MSSFDQRKSGETAESENFKSGGLYVVASQHSVGSQERWKGQNVHGL